MKSEFIEHNGIIFRRYPDSERRSDRVYLKKTINGKDAYLHRVIYEEVNGRIPKGMHIHHKDGNELNNSIENLELLTPAEHANEHMDEEGREWRRKNLSENARPKASEWHRDPANRQHHVDIGGMAYKNFNPEDKQCQKCNKPFRPKKLGSLDKFCSNSCKSAARRDSGVDDIEVKCELCGAAFMKNKYLKNVFCSKSCAMKARWKNKSS